MPVSIAEASLSIAVLSLSEKTGYHRDSRSAHLARRLRDAGHRLGALVRLPDLNQVIEDQMQAWIDGRLIDVVMTVNDDAPGAIPPLILMTSNDQEQPQFTRLMRDEEVGYVSVINLRSARAI